MLQVALARQGHTSHPRLAAAQADQGQPQTRQAPARPAPRCFHGPTPPSKSLPPQGSPRRPRDAGGPIAARTSIRNRLLSLRGVCRIVSTGGAVEFTGFAEEPDNIIHNSGNPVL